MWPGGEVLVAREPRRDVEAAAGQPVRSWPGADADEDGVGADDRTVVELDSLDPGRAVHDLRAARQAERDAVVGVQSLEGESGIAPQDRLHRHRQRVDDGHDRPRLRAVAATSIPTKPAPTTTGAAPSSRSRRSARQSAGVRSVWRPGRAAAPGRPRAAAPVATTSLS